MFFKILEVTTAIFLSLVTYANTAPVNTACITTISTNLYAYCSKTTSSSDIDIQRLYEESDEEIFETIEELCKITVSNSFECSNINLLFCL